MLYHSRHAYSNMTSAITAMQEFSQVSAAVVFFALGELLLTLLAVLISIKNKVTSNPIRPGTSSTGMKNDMNEAHTRIRVGTNKLYMK